jgi:hypothetical protein
VSDRLVRFAGDSWQEIEALPESVYGQFSE